MNTRKEVHEHMRKMYEASLEECTSAIEFNDAIISEIKDEYMEKAKIILRKKEALQNELAILEEQICNLNFLCGEDIKEYDEANEFNKSLMQQVKTEILCTVEVLQRIERDEICFGNTTDNKRKS